MLIIFKTLWILNPRKSPNTSNVSSQYPKWRENHIDSTAGLKKCIPKKYRNNTTDVTPINRTFLPTQNGWTDFETPFLLGQGREHPEKNWMPCGLHQFQGMRDAGLCFVSDKDTVLPGTICGQAGKTRLQRTACFCMLSSFSSRFRIISHTTCNTVWAISKSWIGLPSF